jgi:hypothetical protein
VNFVACLSAPPPALLGQLQLFDLDIRHRPRQLPVRFLCRKMFGDGQFPSLFGISHLDVV